MLQKITTPKFLIGLLASFFVLSSEAAITINSVTNASASDLTATTPLIYGGLGGTDAGNNGSDPVNSCGTGFTVCNPARIYGGLDLKITYTSSTNAGRALATNQSDTGTAIVLESGSTNGTSISSGSTHTVVIKWDNICGYASSTSGNCAAVAGLDTNQTLNINLGVDETGDGSLEDSTPVSINITPTTNYANTATAGSGLDQFTAFPGDEKTFISPSRTDAFSFPSTPTQIKFKYVRAMYSQTSLAAITPSQAITDGTFTDLEIDLSDTSGTTTALKASTVTGLTNNVTYFFRIALVDEAGNIGYFTPDSLYTGTNAATCGGDTSSPTDIVNCPLTAFPDPVFGLMESDFNCFITTASYGSPLAPEVETFRAFRETFLLPFSWGRTLNRWYYQVGPKAAQSIHNNHFLKSLSQAILYPALWFAKASLSLGIAATLLILLSSFAGFMLLTQRLRKTFARSL